MIKPYTHFLTETNTQKVRKTNTQFLIKEIFEMAYTLEQIEYLHDTGKMPHWIYYQMNGKSAQANFEAQTRKFRAECMKRIEEQDRRKEEERRRKAEEKALEAEIEKKAEAAIEKALDDLLKDFFK